MHEHTQKTKPPLEIIDPSTVFVGVEFVAALLGEEVGTIYNKSPLGKLPFPGYKSGRHIRFKYSEVMEWVDSLIPIPVRTKRIKKNSPNPASIQPPSSKLSRGRPRKEFDNGEIK